jgi:hypothetical protein
MTFDTFMSKKSFLPLARHRIKQGITVSTVYAHIRHHDHDTTAAAGKPTDKNLWSNEGNMSSALTGLCSLCFGAPKRRNTGQTLLLSGLCKSQGMLSICASEKDMIVDRIR